MSEVSEVSARLTSACSYSPPTLSLYIYIYVCILKCRADSPSAADGKGFGSSSSLQSGIPGHQRNMSESSSSGDHAHAAVEANAASAIASLASGAAIMDERRRGSSESAVSHERSSSTSSIAEVEAATGLAGLVAGGNVHVRYTYPQPQNSFVWAACVLHYPPRARQLPLTTLPFHPPLSLFR